ncbi:MAG: tetratricopeptide repeat protein [Candidatus Azobacteroides sp.]|nr:tetratricopeptide repeat protein [Candidatus Azobacteroides sp.]
MKYISLHTLLPVCYLVFLSATLSGQTLEQATALFAEGKYQEAKVAFESVLQKSPNNASANYYYGATNFKLGDWATAEKYLKTAVTRRNNEALLTLGDLYFLSYRFDEAVTNYEKYQATLKKNPELYAFYQEKIDKAEMGKNMLRRVEEVKIIDSMVVDKSRFMDAYKLSASSGKILPFREFFNKADRNPMAAAFVTERGDRVIYTETTEDNGLDLFSKDKMVDSYGNETNLGTNINSSYDENFPFLLNDGVSLYFASNRESSLGGYDIYVTRYNIVGEQYLTPENVGMPFNSPYNDYMMAIDELNGVGWFASDRFQPENKVVIYVFIPNEEKNIIRSENVQHIRNMAKINRIADTWEPGDNYTALLNKIYSQQLVAEDKGDFTFVVADNLIYNKLPDFKNKTAKELFEKAQAIDKNISALEEQLDALRLEYSKANSSKKQQMSSNILKLERELNALYKQPDELYMKARNEEVRFLMKK